MKLENQVTSLELSKKLKSLGVEQKGYFYWKIDEDEPYLVSHNSGYMFSKGRLEASAFTVAELGEFLPWQIKIGSKDCEPMKCGKNAYNEWICEYHIAFQTPSVQFIEKTETNARAEMLIYLIENKLVKL